MVQTPPRIMTSRAGQHLDVMGTDTEVILTGSDTAGNYAMFIITAQPGQGVPMHLHRREEETFHVLEGRLGVESAGVRRVLGPGDSVCLPREVPHTWWTDGDQPVRTLLIVSPAGMEHFFPELAPVNGQPPTLDAVIATSRRFGIEFV